MLYNGHIFENAHGEKFRRVNKIEARNLAKKNVSIGVCACKLDPFNPFYNPCAWFHPEQEKQAFDGYDDFDKFVNAYEYYNCSAETGQYAAYYVEVIR